MKGTGKTVGLQVKLTASFLFIVVLMVILGVISYRQASATILNNYTANAQGTSDAVGLYANSTCEGVTARIAEFINTQSFKDYYTKYYGDDEKGYAYYKEITSGVGDLRSSVSQISNLYVLGENGKIASSVSSVVAKPLYAAFVESEAGKQFAAKPEQEKCWTVTHQDLDEMLLAKRDAYGLSFIRRFIKGEGYVIVDLHRSITDDIIDHLGFGTGSMTALVSQDGQELYHSKTDAAKFAGVFSANPLIQQALAGETAGEHSTYSVIDGDKYLVLYSPIGDTGVLLCSVIPEKLILQEVAPLKLIIILLTVFAGIAAMTIGTVITSSISREVRRMQKKLAKVADGDFTVRFETKRKDEFRDLSDSMNLMLVKIRELFMEMKGFGKEVLRAAEGVSDGTDHILISTKGISNSVEAVESGVGHQADDTESGIVQMTQLAGGIQLVRENTDHMGSVTSQALHSVEEGRDKVSDLTEKTNNTREITRQLVGNIEQVQRQSINIDSIINSINEIAEETNLLSLNASIEAARAGEHGKGFSVVAEEIRKLADQSRISGSQIQQIIQEIQTTTAITTKTAEQTERNMELQEAVLEETIEVFAQISQCVEQLVLGFHDILQQLEKNEEQKECVMDSMRNISGISVKTALTAKEVTTTANQQLGAIVTLNEEAGVLMRKAAELEDSMRKFITE